jgi:large subunit ribosomal protein L21
MSAPNRLETRTVYAIIEDSGTQIKVATGDVVEVDLRELKDKAKSIKFDRVLMLGDEGEGGKSVIGTPYVSGATVAAEVLGETRGDKIDVVKYKRRKGYRRKTGHVQRYLQVKIGEIKGS